jgi:ParB family chromosome partitioning protein
MTAELRRSGGLGRGLAALIPQRDEPPASVELPIAAISHNPPAAQAAQAGQPGRVAASIAEHGVLQPIWSRTAPAIASSPERRLGRADGGPSAFRRSCAAPTRVAPGRRSSLQRADLNPPRGGQLVDEPASHDEVGARQHRAGHRLCACSILTSASTALAEGVITEGQRARAGRLERPAQQAMLSQVVSGGLSVRQTEELVRRAGNLALKTKRSKPARSADVERLEHGLREALATKVTLSTSRKGGRITIEYYTQEELERLYARLTGDGA